MDEWRRPPPDPGEVALRYPRILVCLLQQLIEEGFAEHVDRPDVLPLAMLVVLKTRKASDHVVAFARRAVLAQRHRIPRVAGIREDLVALGRLE